MENIFLILIVGVAAVAWHFSRSRSLRQQWASENGYEILHSEYRHLFRGPVAG